MSDTTQTPTSSISFITLPGELRNKIYELILVCKVPIGPNGNCGFSLKRCLNPRLLRANKAVHREATSLLYSKNCFNFSLFTAEEIGSFLERIGSYNAAYIQHVMISFPSYRLDSSGFALSPTGLDILAVIQSHCINLISLPTPRYSIVRIGAMLDNPDKPDVTAEELGLVNAHFRAIPLLQEIFIWVLEDYPSDYILRRMRSHGWTINVEE